MPRDPDACAREWLAVAELVVACVRESVVCHDVRPARRSNGGHASSAWQAICGCPLLRLVSVHTRQPKHPYAL